MKSEPSADVTEIIEIIDDGDDADFFGEHARTTTDDDDGRRRVASVVVVALLMVIGYGVVTSAISSGSTAPPTPTSLPSSTVPRSTIAAVSPSVTVVSPEFYVADPAPEDFIMHFAETLGMGGNTAEFTDGGTAELWATPDSTSTTGSWFVVSRGTRHATGRNAYRTVVGDTEVVVEHDPSSGQSRLAFTKDGNEMEVTAFGWADRQLLRLVDSTYVADSLIRYHDTFFTTDHSLLLDSDPVSALYGLPVAWVGYTTGTSAGLAEGFTITVAAYSPADRDVATRFAMRDSTTFFVHAFPAIVGHLAADPRLSIVQWGDGQRLITLRGNVDAERLAAIAATVHPSPDATVAQLVDNSSETRVVVTPGEPRTIASGMLTDGLPFTIQVSLRNRDDPAGGYLWGTGQRRDSTSLSETRPSQADAAASIETLVEHGRTYVLAKVPRAVSGAQLHVNPNGLPSLVLPLADIDPAFSDLFAAYVFSEAVPLTAQIIDGNGTAVASWP